MVKYYLDREHQLLRSIARDNKAAAAGWWREMGKGRLVYLSMGHTPDGLQHPNDPTSHSERDALVFADQLIAF